MLRHPEGFGVLAVPDGPEHPRTAQKLEKTNPAVEGDPTAGTNYLRSGNRIPNVSEEKCIISRAHKVINRSNLLCWNEWSHFFLGGLNSVVFLSLDSSDFFFLAGEILSLNPFRALLRRLSNGRGSYS